jgi:hypothetical protein
LLHGGVEDDIYDGQRFFFVVWLAGAATVEELDRKEPDRFIHSGHIAGMGQVFVTSPAPRCSFHSEVTSFGGKTNILFSAFCLPFQLLEVLYVT